MTSNNGTTFTLISASLPSQAIGAIAIDPVNTTPTTIYVATGEGNNSGDSYYGQGIFKSTNLGSTWTPILPVGYMVAVSSEVLGHPSFTKLAIDTSHNPPYLFATADLGGSANRAGVFFGQGNPANQGLWRSLDGGSTWSHYASTTFNGCSYLSGPCPGEDISIDPANPNQVYAAIAFSGVWRSQDSGNTWTQMVLPGLPGLPGRESIVVGPPASGAPSNCTNGPCGIVYTMIGAATLSPLRLANQYSGFYMSTDGGANWTQESVPSAAFPGVTIDGTSPSNTSQAFYDQALAVSPSNPNDVFFGGLGLYESTSNGANNTWTFLPSVYSPSTHSDQHALVFQPAPNSSTLLIGNDGGLYTWDATNGFVEQNDTINAGQVQSVGIHPSNASTAIVGFQDNGTQRDVGSLSWSVTDTGDGGSTHYSFGNPAYAYHLFAGRSQVNYSSDHGQTWSSTQPSLSAQEQTTFYPPLSVSTDPANVRRAFFAGAEIHALAFSNGIPQWTTQESTDLTGGCLATGLCEIGDVEFSSVNPAVAWTVSTPGGAPEPTTNQTSGFLKLTLLI